MFVIKILFGSPKVAHYVDKHGAYVTDLKQAKRFSTREDAEGDRMRPETIEDESACS